jgi:hypothetical protein
MVSIVNRGVMHGSSEKVNRYGTVAGMVYRYFYLLVTSALNRKAKGALEITGMVILAFSLSGAFWAIFTRKDTDDV